VTTLATKFNRAENWSARLPIARDIWQEVRAERTDAQTVEVPSVESVPVAQAVDVDAMSFDELERLTAPQANLFAGGN
jgi:hypothetical protein